MSAKANERLVRRIYEELWNERKLEVADEIIAEGDRVVLRCTLTGTHEGPFMGIPPTGKRIEVTEIHIYRLKDGKAVEHRVGRDDLGAMRQLGVIADAVPEPGSAPHATAVNAPE
jgi:hypothetical protein